MRICLVTSLFRPVIGGEEHHAELLARALHARGHQVCVVTQRVRGAPRREILDGVRVERAICPVDYGPLFGPSYVATLARFLRDSRQAFDIIQTTYFYWDAVTAAMLRRSLCARLVVRLVIAGPGGDLDRFRTMRLWPLTARYDRGTLDRLVRLVARRADAFLCLNERAREEAVALGVKPRRCHVVPNGIDVARFAAVIPSAADDRRRVLSVARLVPQKGLDVLLKALPVVREAMGDVTLTLLGEGPERARLGLLAEELGVADGVRFGGVVTDVAPYFSVADVFVLPSRFEGLPLALLEAMAAGLPVVATAVDGNVDVVRNGMDGLVVPPDDPVALASALIEVLSKPDLALRLGAAARRRVAELYDVESMTNRTCEVYQRVLEAPPARATR
jgi:glycosyltransferase involved in cell wall biosynthesis